MRTILRFPRSDQDAWRIPPAVLSSLAERYGFSVRTADTGIFRTEDVAELLAFWRPAGCIVNNDLLAEDLFRDIPTVFCHRRPSAHASPRHACVTFDEKAFAQAAAHELLALDLASYAFMPSPEGEEWSRAREEHFVRVLGLNGHGVAVFPTSRRPLSQIRLLSRMADWLATIPRPVGVFAANDDLGALVIAACAQAGLDVPDDVAVIGVDNVEGVCETTQPALSSLAPDLVAFRTATYELLRGLIETPDATAPRMATIPPLDIVRRTSTRRLAKTDPSVLAACELIRRNACDGLRARDVAATFPCGRRMAEIRFRAAVGHSILDEIRAVRQARARELRAESPDRSREVVASLCGYSSRSSLHRLLNPRT